MTFFEWFSNLFQNLGQALTRLGELLFDIAGSVIYLLQAAGQVLVLVVQLLWQLGNVLLSFATGLISTLRNVAAPDTWTRGALQSGWDNMAGVLPLDTIGWVLAGIVWIVGATAIIRIVRQGAR